MGLHHTHHHSTEIHPSTSTSPSYTHSTSTHASTISPTLNSPIHLNTTSSMQSRWPKILTITRLLLTLLAMGAAAAVVGCQAHALDFYNDTNLGEEFFLPPLWPVGEGLGLDLRSTQGMVVGGAVVVLVGVVYLGVGVVKVPRRFKLMTILLSLSLSIFGLAGAVFGVTYTTYISSRSGYQRDDLQSWTCRWVDGADDAVKMLMMADLAAPEGFGRVCVETKVGFVLLAVLVGLESVVLVLTGLCAGIEVRVRRVERRIAEEGDVVYGEKGDVGREVF